MFEPVLMCTLCVKHLLITVFILMCVVLFLLLSALSCRIAALKKSVTVYYYYCSVPSGHLEHD